MENKSNRTDKGLSVELLSTDIRTVRAAIKKISREGRLKDIPAIIEAMLLQEKETLRKELKDLLCDIQLAGSTTYIIEGIKNPHNEPILPELLSVCWESKHDFTAYLDIFVGCFVVADYNASVEAFTIIEKIFTDYEMPEEKLLSTLGELKKGYPTFTENKKKLAFVLMDSLEGLKDM